MNKTIPLILNLFGGPGSGKSTTAARVFAYLKEHGYKCELVTEYAKDVNWEQAFNKLNNQLYIFAKQDHRIWRVSDKVDIIITDSPLILSLVYGKDLSIHLQNLIIEEYTKFPHLSVYLERVVAYEQIGRSQNEEEAKLVDNDILLTMKKIGLNFDLVIPGDSHSTEPIVNLINEKMRNANN